MQSTGNICSNKLITLVNPAYAGVISTFRINVSVLCTLHFGRIKWLQIFRSSTALSVKLTPMLIRAPFGLWWRHGESINSIFQNLKYPARAYCPLTLLFQELRTLEGLSDSLPDLQKVFT